MTKQCVVCGKDFEWKRNSTRIICSSEDCARKRRTQRTNKYRERHPEKVKKSRIDYRKKNIEKLRAYDRSRYEKNPEKERARHKDYWRRNPEKRKEQNDRNHTKYAAALQIVREIQAKGIEALYE